MLPQNVARQIGQFDVFIDNTREFFRHKKRELINFGNVVVLLLQFFFIVTTQNRLFHTRNETITTIL